MIFLRVAYAILAQIAVICLLLLFLGASSAHLIAFSIASGFAAGGWYVWSVRRQLYAATGNITLADDPELLQPMFGQAFSLLYGIAPILTLALIGAGAWFFGWRGAAIMILWILTSWWWLRPIARRHAIEMLAVIAKQVEASDAG